MTAESADPPTIKNAGRLSPGYYGGYDFIGILAVVAMLSVLVGGMALAIMVSHRRRAQGAVIYGVTGLASLLLLALTQVLSGVTPEYLREDILSVGVPFAITWLVVGAVAFAVGSVVRPTGKRPNVSAF